MPVSGETGCRIASRGATHPRSFACLQSRSLAVLALVAPASAFCPSAKPAFATRLFSDVTLHTNFGDIGIELFEDKAPGTTENFLQYCRDGFYDNTLFHRVIDGFMVQGGGLTSGLKEKASRAPIKNEANNGLKNKVGTLAMARTVEPHSASSQFFINVNDNTFLDFRSESLDGWGYCVFGQVSEGMDTVNKIKVVSTSTLGPHQDVPLEDVVITGTTIEV